MIQADHDDYIHLQYITYNKSHSFIWNQELKQHTIKDSSYTTQKFRVESYELCGSTIIH